MRITRWRERKAIVLGLGAVGLATVLTLAAVAAPARRGRASTTYTPADPAAIVATVPARDPAEVKARQELAASPDNVELAVELARADLARYHALSDPRYLGRAQATLGRWWKLAAPPAEVQLLRATILQSTHEFAPARADLDALVAREPANGQAHLTRAVVATITADYAAARGDCAAIATLATPLVAATCEAPLEGIAGRAAAMYQRLVALYAHARADRAVRGWALTALAELAIQLGDFEAAQTHLRAALAVDEEDSYARNLLADVLLANGAPATAIDLLADREQIDSHLVRLAIAAHATHAADADRYIAMMRDRIAAAATRGDRIHLREEARFALAVDGDPRRALDLARANWEVQKELADARLLAEAAAAAGNSAAAAPVVAWARATGVHDVWLDRALEVTP